MTTLYVNSAIGTETADTFLNLQNAFTNASASESTNIILVAGTSNMDTGSLEFTGTSKSITVKHAEDFENPEKKYNLSSLIINPVNEGNEYYFQAMNLSVAGAVAIDNATVNIEGSLTMDSDTISIANGGCLLVDTIYTAKSVSLADGMLQIFGTSFSTDVTCTNDAALLLFAARKEVTVSGDISGVKNLELLQGTSLYFGTKAIDLSATAITVAGNIASLTATDDTITIATGSALTLADDQVVTFGYNSPKDITMGTLTVIDDRYYKLDYADGIFALQYLADPKVTNPNATGDGSFASVVENAIYTIPIKFSDDNTTYKFNTVTAAHNLEIIGNGTEDTVLDGNALYVGGFGASLSNLTFDGNISGGKFKSNGAADSLGDLSLTLEDVAMTADSRVFGGSVLANDGSKTLLMSQSGDIALNFKIVDGADAPARGATIYGAGSIKGGTMWGTGSVTTTFEEGTGVLGNFYAGVLTANDGKTDSYSTGTVTTTVNGGTFSYFGNGSKVYLNDTATQYSSTLTINDGTFNEYVYAGGFSCGGTSIVDGDTTLTINGGTFNKYVFAGSGANSSANGNKTEINAFEGAGGNTTLYVNAKTDTITFNDNIYGGSMGVGSIAGETAIIFKGTSDKLVFGDNVFVSGDSQMARAGSTAVEGNRYLVFDSFSGDFDGGLNNGFNILTLRDSKVNLTRVGNLTAIETWNIDVWDADVKLTMNGGFNSFKGDKLNVSGDVSNLGTDGWDVIKGTATNLSGWTQFARVELLSEEATYADGAWTSEHFKLYKEDNTLKIAKLA